MACQQAAFSLEKANFRYEPFPIGFLAEIFHRDYYDQLLENWPADYLFEYKPAHGSKFSLSEVNHPDIYSDFISETEPWRHLHHWIKTPDFIEQVLDMLRRNNIDLGYTAERLSARFEFSMLSAQGGHVIPHTDAVNKIITLVFYMPRVGEWHDSLGGGTAVLRPKDPRKTYNYLNVDLGFEEVESLYSLPYAVNSGTIFIKTFNSYHAVFPMQGPVNLMRRSLTINIEDKHDPRLAYLARFPARKQRFFLN